MNRLFESGGLVKTISNETQIDEIVAVIIMELYKQFTHLIFVYEHCSIFVGQGYL